jgi:tRNA (cmo5U34)-methyltransferase
MNSSDQRDRVYAEPRACIDDFRFDQDVARVFPDMIRRSVPGYATVINMTSVLASRFVVPDTNVYDLGCSLGASSLAVHRGVGTTPCRIYAIDNSDAMIATAREHLVDEVPENTITWVCEDIQNTVISQASMVILNFTLQFITREQRLGLLRQIHHGMRKGGILVLSEKITFEDPEEEARQIALHHAFKRANGYNDLEISQKRTALEKVLLPETLATHKQRLVEAGFTSTDLWFQCFNFVSLVAIK